MLLRSDLKRTAATLTSRADPKTIDPPPITLGDRKVGKGCPVYIAAEIGINHNGSLQTALSLIDVAADAGCDAVKFQKRSPDDCVPKMQREVSRKTPWGKMTYLQYRHRMEFGDKEYVIIDRHCRHRNIAWFASCWDKASIDFISRYNPICYKIASACITNLDLLRYTQSKEKPVILSTGMSTMEEIQKAVCIFDPEQFLITHATSNYSGKLEELNLLMINTLREKFGLHIGYSGHEQGIVPTLATISMGACYVERHITLDRSMWGSDHIISLEPQETTELVRNIRIIEKAMGDGIKRVYDSEKLILAKLRNCF